MLRMVFLEYVLHQGHILCLGLFLPLTSTLLPSLILIFLSTMQMTQVFLGLVITLKHFLFQPIQLKLLFVREFRQLMSIRVSVDGLKCVLKSGTGRKVSWEVEDQLYHLKC
jgi:hypothetical protein